MHKNDRLQRIMTHIALILIVMVIFTPVITMLSTAFKPAEEVYITSQLLPRHPTWVNFNFVINKSNFLVNMRNSLIVSLSVTFVATIVASFAGYALSRFRTGVFRTFQSFLLLLYIFPGMLAMIPLFRIFSSLDLLDRLQSIILIYLTGNLPFSIWMSKGFFDGIPFDIEEAAMIEGVSQFKAFLKVVVPISTPGLAAVGIFCYINSWNEYMQASIFLKKILLRQ